MPIQTQVVAGARRVIPEGQGQILVQPERERVIGPQRSLSRGQQLVAQERSRLVEALYVAQRAGEIGASLQCAFVRDAENGHLSGIDLALEDEGFVVPPEQVEGGRNISLSDEAVFLVARPIAPCQS